MPAIETPPVTLGWKASNFNLKGTDGTMYNLDSVKGPSGLVVMFICNHCPYVQAIASKLSTDAKVLAEIGVNSVAIMSNDTDVYPEDSFENMINFKNSYNFNFPYLIDETQEVARAYQAVCTPDFFGFDSSLKLQYRGRFDPSGMKRQDEEQKDLLLAMSMIAINKIGPKIQHPSIGCSIKWRA